MANKQLHIVFHDPLWVAKHPHESAPLGEFPTQDEAVHWAREELKANGEGGDLIVHGHDGKIHWQDTVGLAHDPRRSRG